MNIDLDLVKKFLVREDLNSSEKKVRDKCINIEKEYMKSLQDLQSKEQEVSTLKSYLEAFVMLAYELERDRDQSNKEKVEEQKDGK